MYDKRGSVWRKWDLHFHTQTSFDYENKSITNREIVDGLLEEQISVVAVTDHHTIDTEKIEDLRELANGRITFLPGIEFRAELGGRESVHFIGIFPALSGKSLETLWTKLQGKLNITDEDIERRGDENIYHSFKETAHIIHELDGLVTVHAGTKSNSFENIGNAHSFKQALKRDLAYECIDIFEVGNKNDISDYKEIVFPSINQEFPLIIGSDNHNIGSYAGSDYTWIKADPTFEGLRQITIEPNERVFIGATPPKIETVEENRTNFISNVNFKKTKSAKDDDVWFENLPKIHLNHDLVAVIGNKGTGKSAFTDIISLVGKTTNYSNFSFLSKDKFRNPQNDKSQHYEATLKWEDGSIDGPTNLSENPNAHDLEKVKYLPQNFIEDLCNPITKEETEKFEKELKEVIFSWVPADERLNQSSLDGIIDYKSEVTEEKINDLRDKINKVNKKILSLENKLTEEYRRTIEEKLEKKKNELKSHIANKPNEVKEPEKELEEDSELKEINDEFRNLKLKISDLKTRKDKYHSIVKKINDRIAATDRLKDRIELIENYIQGIEIKSSEDLALLELDFDELINVKANLKTVTDKKAKLLRLKKKIQNYINNESEENEKSLSMRIKELLEQKDELKNKLDKRNQVYQEYLTELEEWEERKEELVGAEDKLNSKKYYEKELERIDGYPDAKKELEQEREKLVRKVHKKYIELKSLYSDLYKPVYEFIESHKKLLEDFQLSFDVSIETKKFKKDFLNKINQGRKGTFQGKEDGFKNLSGIHDSVDFNEEEELVNFLESMNYALHNVKGTDEKNKIKDQLVDGEDPISLYEYLFGLEYLDPTYKLKLDDKNLNQLSPGERGILLLIFYLLISQDNRPLIIDQPEENLDNETVYKVLVKCIREAKKRRQVIIVTHNPNLAVVCDAEQVIIADIAKKEGNKVTYTCGAIENPTINKEILNILEGTRPAFNNRDAKYIA